MSKVIVCPSGMSLQIRGMRGKELKILSDRKALRSGAFLDKIISACTEAVIDPGPYDFQAGDGPPEWDKVLVGDKVFATISVRVATFGADFPFKGRCRQCGEQQEYSIQLDQLEVQKLDSKDAIAFRVGNEMTAELPGETPKKVVFRLATGADEKRVAKAVDSDEAMILMMSYRIVSIEGIDNVKGYLNDAGLEEIMSLLREFNKRDCGVDTDIEVECSKCEFRQAVKLPLGPEFWLKM